MSVGTVAPWNLLRRLPWFAAVALPLALAIGGAPRKDRDPAATITAYIEAHNTDAVSLLERIVNVNSGTHNLEGVREVGRILRAELNALGFKTEWIDGAPWQRAGHLVAERPGDSVNGAGGPRILLIGHLDTVFERDSPFQKFERVGRSEARGPGVIDMKGGDVVLVQALKALAAAGALGGLNIAVVLTGDEEAPGRPLALARAALVKAAQGATAAIGFEDGPGDPRYAVASRRGTTSWTLRVTGTTAHSSQVFRSDIGPGAIFEAARILNGFREALADQEHLTFNPGLIVGGTDAQYDAMQARGSAAGKDNVVAGRVVVTGDLRALSREQFERAKKSMQAVVAARMPHTEGTLEFDDAYPPMAPTEGNARLLDLYSRASQVLGFGPVLAINPDRAGAADVSFVAGHAGMVLDGVGLMGRDGHTLRETADLTTLPSQTKRAAMLLLRLAQGGAPRSRADKEATR
jgi:glutamate carboxypeptidase